MPLWYQCNRSSDVWRRGTIKEIHGTQSAQSYGTRLDCEAETPKRDFTIRWWNVEYQTAHGGTIPVVPVGTRAIRNTWLGRTLANRMSGSPHFEVYECSDRITGKGTLLGYIVVPCWIWEARSWYKRPSYKVWQVPPDVQALLHFLGEKTPEIVATYLALTKEINGKETIAKTNSSVAAD